MASAPLTVLRFAGLQQEGRGNSEPRWPRAAFLAGNPHPAATAYSTPQKSIPLVRVKSHCNEEHLLSSAMSICTQEIKTLWREAEIPLSGVVSIQLFLVLFFPELLIPAGFSSWHTSRRLQQWDGEQSSRHRPNPAPPRDCAAGEPDTAEPARLRNPSSALVLRKDATEFAPAPASPSTELCVSFTRSINGVRLIEITSHTEFWCSSTYTER